DRADRSVLRARRADQVTLGGNLGWQRDRGGGAGVLRFDPQPRRRGGDGLSADAEHRPVELLAPELRFEVTGAAHVVLPATPTMLFSASASDPSEHEIQSIALTVQVMIDPARRGYEPETRERLAELFGPPASWTPSTSGLAWARVAATVPGFIGSTPFGVEGPGTYGLGGAGGQYFFAGHDGRVPPRFSFKRTRVFFGPT